MKTLKTKSISALLYKAWLLIFIFILPVLAFAQSGIQTYRISESQLSIEGTARDKSWLMKASDSEGKLGLSFRDGKPQEVTELTFSIRVEDLKSENPKMDQRAYKALKAYPHERIKFAGKINQLKRKGAETYLIIAEGNLYLAGNLQIATLHINLNIHPDGSISAHGNHELLRSKFQAMLPEAEERIMQIGDRVKLNFSVTLLKE